MKHDMTPGLFGLSALLMAGTLGMLGLARAAEGNGTGCRAEARRERRERRLQRLSHRLQLSAAQQTRIAPVVREHGFARRVLRRDASLSPEARRARLQALRRRTRERIFVVLSPAQRDQLRRLSHERRAARTA